MLVKYGNMPSIKDRIIQILLLLVLSPVGALYQWNTGDLTFQD